MSSLSITDRTYTIGKKELVFLAAHIGHNALIGVSDPFLGYLAEQVEEQWSKSKKILIDQEMIYIDDKDNISIMPELHEAVKICCYPDSFVIFEIIDADEKKSRTINMSGKKSVLVSDGDETVELTVYADGEYDLRAVVYENLALPNTSASEGKAEVPADCFEETLQGAMVSDEFKDVLNNPDNKALVMLGDMYNSVIDTFGLYTKDDSVLIINENIRSTLEIECVNSEEVYKRISGHMSRI